MKNYLTNYINGKINEINSKFPNHISNQQRDNFIKNNVKENMTEEEVNEKIKYIDDLFKQIIKQQEKLQQLRKELARELQKKKNEKTEQPKIFGQTYKSTLIEIFKMYDQIQKTEGLSETDKKEMLEKQVSDYIPKMKEEFRKYLEMQTNDTNLINYGMQSLFLGYESLSYETIKNLKEIFDNDLNMVQCESEGKLKMTLPGNQTIFDSNGNINPYLKFDFSKIKIIYDYAKQNGKQIKHHELLWHNSVPENLKNEIEKINGLSISETEKQSIKRNMCLKFYETYFKQLSNFFIENGYDIRQIDVLNEIANDKKDGAVLRESFWSQNIGSNPQNGDAYFIDILRMAKQYFPNSELIYNDYNEFVGYKCDRMCEIIKYIQTIEKRDNVKLIDGLGLQSHYRDFVPELGRNLTEEDIMETSIKFMKLGIPLYLTEFDFNNEKNSNIQPLIDSIASIYGVAANGFNAWGNSDQITWTKCLDKEGNYLNSHIIDKDGNKKESFNLFFNKFIGLNNVKNNSNIDKLKKYMDKYKAQMKEYLPIEQQVKELKHKGISNIEINGKLKDKLDIFEYVPKILYHGSPENLDVINAKESTQAGSYVYATDNPIHALFFSIFRNSSIARAHISEYIDEDGIYKVKYFIDERVQNALDEIITDKNITIHVCDGDDFYKPQGEAYISREWISKEGKSIIPLDKIEINIKDFFKNLEKDGLVEYDKYDKTKDFKTIVDLCGQNYAFGLGTKQGKNLDSFDKMYDEFISNNFPEQLIFSKSLRNEIKNIMNTSYRQLNENLSESEEINYKLKQVKNLADSFLTATKDQSGKIIWSKNESKVKELQKKYDYENKEEINSTNNAKKGPEFKTFKFLKSQREQNQSTITNHEQQKATVYENQRTENKKLNENSLVNNKVKKLTKSNSNSNSSSGGFVNILILTLIVGFVAGTIFIIVYNIIK